MRRRRRCGTAIARRRIRCRPRRASSSRSAPTSAQANLEKKLALCERAEALADSTDWIKTADELKKLQLEWQAIGPVPRPDTRVVWKRFREACDRVLQPPQRRPRAAEGSLGDEPGEERSAVCPRGTTGRVARVGARGRGDPSAAGGLEDDRSRAPDASPKRCGSGSAPHAISSSIATSGATRSSSKRARRIAKRSPSSSRHCCPAEEAAGEPPADLLERVRSLRTRWNQSTPAVKQGADPLSARFVAAIERLLSAYPTAFKGTELDVEASRQRMEKLCARVEGFVSDNEPVPVVVAGARRHAARGARRQHHRRPRRRRVQVARAWPTTCVRRRRRGRGWCRFLARVAGRSRTASTRRATGSSSSPGATCRRSSHRRVADGPCRQRAE